MGVVLERELHLPDPRVLDGQTHALARAVALEGERDMLLRQILRDAVEQSRRARLDPVQRIVGQEQRQLRPARPGFLLGGGQLERRDAEPRLGGLDPDEGVIAFGTRVGVGEHHGQHVRDRRARVAAAGEGVASAERQQTAAPLVDEVGDHLQLVAGEEARFHRSQNQAAIGIQLRPGIGEPALQLFSVVDVQAQELVLGGTLQDHQLQIVVIRHRAPQESHLVARLALEVEDLLAPVLDAHQRRLAVVLRDLLVHGHRNAEGVGARARRGGGEANRNRDRLPVVRQLDLLGADDLSLVFDDQRHGLALVAHVRDHHVDHHRGTREHRPGRVGAADLDVPPEALLAHAHGVDRNPLRLQRHERLGQLFARVVRSVGDQDQARERHRGQFGAGALERRSEARAASHEAHLGEVLDAVRARREAEVAHREAVGQGGEDRGIRRAEGLLQEGSAGAAVEVLDLHAAGIVQQHAHEVLLRHHRRDHQGRPQKTEGEHRESREAESPEHQAIQRPGLAAHAQVGQKREQADQACHYGAGRDRARHPQGEVALLEDDRPVLEEELEEAGQHVRGPVSGSWRR